MTIATDRTIQNECYSCIHRRNIPGDAHIACAKPDPNMTGNLHGIRCGWFMYPGFPKDFPLVGFDPTWKTKLCDNWEGKQSESLATADSAADEPDAT